ncbi:Holin of 3TMs, for gene-transfer release [uncultured Caudovirales phage]|uniref:Holin of 3TMs, for gene-transfer release n=1 Tax=uncultured Caudovirales phage TaxID=2100421 RepID=A0A6J5KXL0_9CAUD|nr:Holin of 3TMs, for gene-transfer release [uncultured Caudovirales phage]CAB5208954.1 Holin of 3TMs, for gene-transfer release [uncultured Caudovirales phage]
MSEEGKEVLDGDKKEDWMNAKWRPMMGWMYMLVCTCDFVIFPVLWSLVQTMGHGRIETQWQPITLSGAGLFHMAMGAIIGVAAFGRTQEKLAGASQVGTTVSSPSFGAPSFGSPSTPSFGSPSTPSFSSPSTPAPSFSSPAPSFGGPAPSAPAPSFGSSAPAVGKFGKVIPQDDQPAL